MALTTQLQDPSAAALAKASEVTTFRSAYIRAAERVRHLMALKRRAMAPHHVISNCYIIGKLITRPQAISRVSKAEGGVMRSKDFRIKPPSRSQCVQCLVMDSPCINWRTRECESRQRNGKCVTVSMTDGACDCMVKGGGGSCFDKKSVADATKSLVKQRAAARAAARAVSWARVKARHHAQASRMHELSMPTRVPTTAPTEDPCVCTGVPDMSGDGK
jgi:hypothetical protein